MRVSVVILCYNLEYYIERAIKSALMQKTSFKFEVIVLNDGSIDGSLQVINRFENQIRLINHESNKGLIQSRIESYDSCNGKYITVLDGDDYWTDGYKLQKQVDLLEKDRSYGMCHTGFELNDEIKGEFVRVIRARHMEGNIFESLMFNNKIASCTVMFKKTLWDNVDKEAYSKLNGSEDRFLWMHISKHSIVTFLVDSTAVYTKRLGSMSGYKDKAKQSKFAEESYDIRYYFIDKYGFNNYLQQALYTKAIKIAESINNQSMGNKAAERLKKVL